MQALLLKLVRKYIIEQVIKLAGYLLRQWQRHSKIDKAVDELKEAGTKPELTPEEKAKEIENAFDHLSDTANKRP